MCGGCFGIICFRANLTGPVVALVNFMKHESVLVGNEARNVSVANLTEKAAIVLFSLRLYRS